MTQTLTDHDAIKRWAREHGAIPAHVKGARRGNEADALRFEMDGLSNDNRLERIDWDAWFRQFDEGGLALVVDDAVDAPVSNKIVRRAASGASRAANTRISKPINKPAAPVERDELFGDSDDEVDDFEDEDEDR